MSSSSEENNLENILSNMSESDEETKDKHCLFAAIRYLDNESRTIIAVPAANVKGLDTVKPNFNEFYQVWHDDKKEFVPAQVFKVCTTEKEALADHGSRIIFKKMRRSAADIEIERKEKKKAAADAKKRRQKKKLLADRDKKLSTDILNRSSTVWLIEEAKDKIEPASVNESRQAKPPKNLNTKTDEKLLRRRFSTLKSDQLEFSSNTIVNKKEIVIKDERKILKGKHSVSLENNKKSPLSCTVVEHAIVHNQNHDGSMNKNRNKDTTIKNIQTTNAQDFDSIHIVPDEHLDHPASPKVIIDDLRQQLQSIELSHQLAIQDYKEQLVETTKRMDELIAHNQFLQKQVNDLTDRMNCCIDKYQKLQDTMKFDQAERTPDKSISQPLDEPSPLNSIVSNGKNVDIIEISSTDDPPARETLSSNNYDCSKFVTEKVISVKREKVESYSSLSKIKSYQAGLTKKLVTPMRSGINAHTAVLKQEPSPALSTASFSVTSSAAVPSKPSGKAFSPPVSPHRASKRKLTYEDSAASIKRPRLINDRAQHENTKGSDDEGSLPKKAAKESSEADYQSDKYPTFAHSRDFKSFEVEDENGKKTKYYHFKFGFYIHHNEWHKLAIITTPSIYVRKLSKLIWKSTEILRRRALKPNKAKPIDGKPRLPLTPQKKALLQKCYIDFLKRNFVKSRREKMENDWRGFLSTYINSLNGNARGTGIKRESKEKTENESTSDSLESDAEF